MPGKTLEEFLKENPTESQLQDYFKSLLEEELLISVFNNKGGVGKSSACAELATILAQYGMKVLVVDADSQGSVSSRILHRNFIEIGKKQSPDEKDEQILADLGEDIVREQHNPTDSQELIDIRAFFTQVNSRPANPQELSRTVNRVKLFKAKLNKKPEREEGGVWVMLGALDLENVETMISNSLALGAQLNSASVSIPGTLAMAIRCLARARGFDAVFIDLNPAPTALNQCLLMGSNYYEVPYTADFSSLRAVKNLVNIIPRWNEVIDTKDLRAPGLEKLILHPVGCFPPAPTLLAAICHRIPAKMPNAYQRARANIIQQLLRLSPSNRNDQPDNHQSVVSFVVSEAYSTAVAAGLDGTALSDITEAAAKRIHASKEGKTIPTKRHIKTGSKIHGEYLFALAGMIAAMSVFHRSRLHEELFISDLGRTQNPTQLTQPQIVTKKRKQSDPVLDMEILVSTDNNLRYRLERVPGNGNCGLLAAHIQRDHFCKTLRNVFFEEESLTLRSGAKQSANSIIRELFELFSNPQELSHLPALVQHNWNNVFSVLDNKRQQTGKARAQWLAQLPENLKSSAERVQKEEDFYNDPQLSAIASTDDHAEIRALLLAWTQCTQQESQAWAEVRQFLLSSDALDALLNYLTNDGRWVGVQTLLLYARNTQTSLIIHRLDARGNILPAVPREQYIASPTAPVQHIIYNGRDHFDKLIELPATANANAGNTPNPATTRTALISHRNPMTRQTPQGAGIDQSDATVAKRYKQ